MSRYFVSATDYGGSGNDKYPRWRVYAWNRKREPWGHIGNHPVSDYFWTHEEALAEAGRLERGDLGTDPTFYLVMFILGGIIVSAFIVRIVLYFMGVWR